MLDQSIDGERALRRIGIVAREQRDAGQRYADGIDRAVPVREITDVPPSTDAERTRRDAQPPREQRSQRERWRPRGEMHTEERQCADRAEQQSGSLDADDD